MKKIYKDIKESLSSDDDERYKQLCDLFDELREDIIKDKGECDDEQLARTLSHELDLTYEWYLSLCVHSRRKDLNNTKEF